MGACNSMLGEREIGNIIDVQDAKEEKKESEVGKVYDPIQALSKYHRELEANYKVMAESDKEISDHVKALIPLTGYYSMALAPGAYLIIDTNLVIPEGAQAPYPHVSVVISMDGKVKKSKFNGTFIDGRLKQTIGLNDVVDLVFVRPNLDSSNGVVAQFEGLISGTVVKGSTFDNPTSYDTYIGKYYLETKNILETKNDDNEPVLVLEIKPEFQISYDYGSNDGILSKVDGFTFSLNTWFFSTSFDDNSQDVKFIMGSGTGNGLACNDLTDKIFTRNLFSIPKPQIEEEGLPNDNSKLLAEFSGYYHMFGLGENAFLSIEGLYKVTSSGKLWIVSIGVSSDGKTSKQYTFDTKMTFDDNLLTIPDFELAFAREYNSENRSIVSFKGSFKGNEGVSGYTLMNPKPLTAFGGIPLKSVDEKDTLVINSDDKVTFNGKVLDKFAYFPVMRMFFSETGIVLSFGIHTVVGNMCILYETPKMEKANYLFAINPLPYYD